MSDKKISLPGRYAGFSEAVYPKTVKKSLYIESFDKTKLAVDVVFPADEEGKVCSNYRFRQPPAENGDRA